MSQVSGEYCGNCKQEVGRREHFKPHPEIGWSCQYVSYEDLPVDYRHKLFRFFDARIKQMDQQIAQVKERCDELEKKRKK